MFSENRTNEQTRYRALAIAVLLLLAVGLVFGQTLRHEFVNFDDRAYVYENPRVSEGLTLRGIAWVFTHIHGGNWHPLTGLSHLLDCQLYGLHAGGHHLTNVLLHAMTVVCLFLVLWRMTGGLWPSAAVAALFAVHPLRVESVAWVAERKDVLSGLFFMLILGAYVRYVRKPFSRCWYLLLFVIFALGLMAKPMLVTAPLVLLLLDYWPLERFAGSRRRPTPPHSTLLHCNGGGLLSGRNVLATKLARFPLSWRLVIEKLPLLLLGMLFCTATVWAQREAVGLNAGLPLGWRIANALVSYVAYLGQLFCPIGLAAYYPHPALHLPIWTVIGSTLLLACISAVAVACRRRCPYLLVGWLWYVGMLTPVIGLLQVGGQARADRYTYLPQIGLYIALAWGVVDLCRDWAYRRWLCGVSSAVVLAILMGCAWRQTCFWRENLTLWNHTLACTAPNTLAHHNLGCALSDQGQSDAAIAHFQQALQIRPTNAGAYDGIGAALTDRGQVVQAIPYLREALRLAPDFAGAHYDLANALVRSDQVELAIAHYQRALEIEPDYVLAHCKLAKALTTLGRCEEAMSHCEEALAVNANDAEADGDVAWLLATCPDAKFRNGPRAIELAERATKLSEGKKPETLDALAAANAEAGRFPEALAAARQALAIAQRQKQQALVVALRARIALYQTGKPFHQPRPASVR
jgi:tetratricopeptide (TPR) repeat protein